MPEKDFRFPILTVDGVVFQLVNNKLTVLLIERGYEPFLGMWALPGAYISATETSHQALDRMLIDKTGISARQCTLVEQPYAFDDPGRDPRGSSVTVMYIALGRGLTPGAVAGGMKYGQNPQFIPLDALPKLAYDHARIVAFAHNRLKALAASTTVVAPLLPDRFTFLQLQTAYEAIFGKRLDKRNFRKKVQSLGLVEATGKLAKDGAHRPAQLYRFRKAKLDMFASSFD
jgi:8-oxo-dGTP diphosphatase